MAKELKEIIFRDLDRAFGNLQGCVLIDYKGIDSEKTYELRSTLCKSGVEMTVVQNRIARRVFGGHGAPKELLELLRGPTAVLYSESDGAISASKSLVLWRKKNKELAGIKGGLFQGKAMSAKDVEQLSTLPDVATLRQACAALFLAPLAHLATVAQSLVAQFVSAARSHRESLEKGQGGGAA